MIIFQIQLSLQNYKLLTSLSTFYILILSYHPPGPNPSWSPGGPDLYFSKEVTNMRLRQPVSSECVLTLGFGPYPPSLNSIVTTPDHLGLDFAPPKDISNRPYSILASADGIILNTGFNSQAGNFIIISHISPQNLLLSFYHHLERNTTFRGAIVNQGESIAIMGNTGTSTSKHLHFALAILYLQSLHFIDPTHHFIQ